MGRRTRTQSNHQRVRRRPHISMMNRIVLCASAVVVLFAAVDAASQRSSSNACDASSRAEKTAIQMAHHPIPKGAKKYEKYRPRKHSLSDINRKPPPYAVDPMAQARQKLPEYTVVGQADMTKFVKVTKADGSIFYHTKNPHSQA